MPTALSFGSVVTFTTEPCTPGAFTGVAAVVGQTGATLLGAVNPNGTLTNAHFEWGATTAYGNITPDQAMGSGLDPVMMGAEPITGLVCNTTYHFRTVAQNSFGSRQRRRSRVHDGAVRRHADQRHRLRVERPLPVH